MAKPKKPLPQADPDPEELKELLRGLGWTCWRDDLPPNNEKRILNLNSITMDVEPTWGDQFHRWMLVERMNLERKFPEWSWWMPLPVPPPRVVRQAIAEERLPEVLRGLDWIYYEDSLPPDSSRTILSLFRGNYTVNVTNGCMFCWALDWERRYGKQLSAQTCYWWMFPPVPPAKLVARIRAANERSSHVLDTPPGPGPAVSSGPAHKHRGFLLL